MIGSSNFVLATLDTYLSIRKYRLAGSRAHPVNRHRQCLDHRSRKKSALSIFKHDPSMHNNHDNSTSTSTTRRTILLALPRRRPRPSRQTPSPKLLLPRQLRLCSHLLHHRICRERKQTILHVGRFGRLSCII